MSRSGELYMAECEQAEERFCATNNLEEFIRAMKELGFDPLEIEERIREIES